MRPVSSFGGSGSFGACAPSRDRASGIPWLTVYRAQGVICALCCLSAVLVLLAPVRLGGTALLRIPWLAVYRAQGVICALCRLSAVLVLLVGAP